MGSETSIALLLNLLVFKSINRDLLGLLILAFISILLCSLPNLPISCLFTEDISQQYLDLYITVSHNDFGN